MNIIDKVIITNLKMSGKEIGISISALMTVCIARILALYASYTGLYIIIPVVILGIYLTLEKMFYTSIFGNTAQLYNSFPVETKYKVTGKVLAASFIVYFYVGALIALYMLKLIFEDGVLEDFSMSYSFIAIKSLELIALIISVISQITYIFLAVVIFNTHLKKGFSKIQKILFCLISGAVFIMIYYCVVIFYLTGVLTNEIILSLISMILSSALIAPLGQKTIDLLDSKYGQR